MKRKMHAIVLFLILTIFIPQIVSSWDLKDNKFFTYNASISLNNTLGGNYVDNNLQQKTFLNVSSRTWVFWCRGQNGTLLYKTSTNYETWTSAIAIFSQSVLSGEDVDIALDGNEFNFAIFNSNFAEKGFLYRVATANLDGTLTWKTPSWNKVLHTVLTYPIEIEFDSDGYAWIAYDRREDNGTVTAEVTRNSVKNGSWIVTPGFPDNFGYSFGSLADFCLIKLDDGQMYFFNFYFDWDIYESAYWVGRLWDGTTWKENEIILWVYDTTGTHFPYASTWGDCTQDFFSIGSDIYFASQVFIDDSYSYVQFVYRKRTSVWSDFQNITEPTFIYDISRVKFFSTFDDSQIWLVYTTGILGTLQASYKNLNDETWSEPITFFNISPRIISYINGGKDNSHFFAITYEDTNYSDYDIYTYFVYIMESPPAEVMIPGKTAGWELGEAVLGVLIFGVIAFFIMILVALRRH